MKKIILLFLLSLAISCIKEPENTTASLAVTGSAEEISCISAKIFGKANLTNKSTADLQIGILLSTSEGVIPSSSTKYEAHKFDADYNFEIILTSLIPQITYYYRTFVYQNGEVEYGDTKKFTTSSTEGIIETLDPGPIDCNFAQLNATLNLGKCVFSKLEYGFYIDSQDQVSKVKVNNIQQGVYSYFFNNLSSESSYSYTAYVKIDNLEIKGKVKSFNTKPISTTVSTNPADNVSETHATIFGQISESSPLIEQAYFIYSNKAKNIDEIIAQGTIVGAEFSDLSFSARISDLMYNSTYYYVAVVKIHDRILYGDVISFTTKDFMANILVDKITDVTEFRANVSGYYSISSTDKFTADVSFIYSSTSNDIATIIKNGKRISCTSDSQGVYKVNLENLNYNTTYYCIAEIKILDKIIYSDVKSFHTANFNATLSLSSPKNITRNEIEFDGQININSIELLYPSISIFYSQTYTNKEDLILNGEKRVINFNENGYFSYQISSLKEAENCYYIIRADILDKSFYSEFVSFKTKGDADFGEAIDLGLSVLWRSCNIGSDFPEEYGNYYAWGETEAKYTYSWDTYKWAVNGYPRMGLTKYCNDSYYGTVDGKIKLENEDDVAYIHLGEKWRYPTVDEWQELIDNCTWTLKTINGINGYIVSSNISGYTNNSIFLPTCGEIETGLHYGQGIYGCYWSSEICLYGPTNSHTLLIDQNGVKLSEHSRRIGVSIRPVYTK